MFYSAEMIMMNNECLFTTEFGYKHTDDRSLPVKGQFQACLTGQK